MNSVPNEQPAIIRTERGLSIAGTRITLYDVMDYLKAQYPRKFIHDASNFNVDTASGLVFSFLVVLTSESDPDSNCVH